MNDESKFLVQWLNFHSLNKDTTCSVTEFSHIEQALYFAIPWIVDRPATPKLRFNQPGNNKKLRFNQPRNNKDNFPKICLFLDVGQPTICQRPMWRNAAEKNENICHIIKLPLISLFVEVGQLTRSLNPWWWCISSVGSDLEVNTSPDLNIYVVPCYVFGTPKII